MSRESRDDLRERWALMKQSANTPINRIGIMVVIGGFAVIAVLIFLKARQSSSSGPYDVNTATAAQLESLPEIGPAMAKDIIDGRPYERLEDLDRVKGIGPKTIEKLRPHLTFPEDG